ncbi:MAG: MBL fold metallo-hydrolase [Paracoccaceae bacterium]
MFAKFLAVAVLFAAVSMPASAQETTREIINVKGDVWRFQNDFYFSVFVITDEGVIVTDPINAEAAAWLKDEIAKMTDKPVTHIIYSHGHEDHSSGGSVLAFGATAITEFDAPASLDGVVPQIRFSDRMVLRSGSHEIELTSLGSGHADDILAMVIRPENVAFVVDIAYVKRLPFRDFPGAEIDELIEQIKRVETLDFEIMVPGHGSLGGPEDVKESREYVEWLRDAVTAELKSGKSVDDIVANLDTSAYENWGSYGFWRDLNIQGMARWLIESGALN